MKVILLRKTTAVFVVGVLSLLLLSACSGVIGGDTVVRISVPGVDGSSSNGRHVSTSNITNGYVVVLRKDKVYSLNNFDDKAFNYLIDGRVYITNLPAGDYIFGIALLDDSDNNYGLAIKEVEIKKGFNDIIINVGPGIITLNVPGIGLIDNPFEPDGFTAEFATDTMIIDHGRSGDVVGLIFDVDFGPGDPTPDNITNIVRIGGAGSVSGLPGTGPYGVLGGADGIEFTIAGGYSYKLILK